MGNYKIAIIPGDGIGPEVIGASVEVMDAIAKNTITIFHMTKFTWVDVQLTNLASHSQIVNWKNV